MAKTIWSVMYPGMKFFPLSINGTFKMAVLNPQARRCYR